MRCTVAVAVPKEIHVPEYYLLSTGLSERACAVRDQCEAAKRRPNTFTNPDFYHHSLADNRDYFVSDSVMC